MPARVRSDLIGICIMKTKAHVVSDGAVTDMDRKSIQSKGSFAIAQHPTSSHTKSATEQHGITYSQEARAIAMRITYFLSLVTENGDLSNSINKSRDTTCELKKKKLQTPKLLNAPNSGKTLKRSTKQYVLLVEVTCSSAPTPFKILL